MFLAVYLRPGWREGGREGSVLPTHPTPPHPQHMHTPLLSSPSLEHPPQSSRVPFRPHTPSLCPSTTLRQGGATGLFEREKAGGMAEPSLLLPPLSRTAPSTFTAHPKPCRAGGEEGRRRTPLSLHPHASLSFSSAFTPLQAFSQQAAGFSPSVSFSSTSHTPPQARIQSADPPAEALLQCRCR